MATMEKDPVFLVIGGNTLARGLTIDGLVCSYFSRNSNQADTLMQMARWFGYRKGFELMQRIWMTESVLKKFEALSQIDMDMKEEIEQFMERGISPELFGPRIRNIPEIKSFRITSKKKSQQAEYDDFDFSGDTYETTDFDNGDVLKKNIEVADAFIDRISQISKREVSKTVKAFVWRNIDYRVINDEFISKYVISPNSGLNVNIPIYRDAIVYQNGAEPYERTMFGAYVLFPYANEDEYRTHNFFESIDKVNIGGLPIMCDASKAEVHILENEAESRVYIEQMWAEMMALYGDGKIQLKLPKEIEKNLIEYQRPFMQEDTWTGLIQEWLDHTSNQVVCVQQIYNEALKEIGKPRNSEAREIGQIMNGTVSGWKAYPNPRNIPGYGKQRGWMRVETKSGNSDETFVSVEATQMEIPFDIEK